MQKKYSVLVIDDEKDFTELISEILTRFQYQVDKVTEDKNVMNMIRHNNYDVVLLDLIMPGRKGIEILQEIKNYDSHIPVIILSGNERSNILEQAMKIGAFDFLKKPVDWSRLENTIKNAIFVRNLEDQISELKYQLEEKYSLRNFVNNSSKMQEVLRNLEKVIRTNVTVCIRGESGTGKELLAKTIHFNSPRKDYPFIAVNCSSIPDSFFEEELFGVVNEDLNIRKYGKLEQAQNGTLYLDDITELSPLAQVKILNALQERKIHPIGGLEPVDINVRIITGSNKNIDEQVRRGKFRDDLYFMIHVFPIFLPPLRQRKEDIPGLVSSFIKKYNLKNNTHIKKIDDRSMEYLVNYSWPGNVRELENTLEFSMLLVEGDTLLPQHLP
ncbi:response regulator, partial [candidate division KSB1 bacterium]|nr:response regulator [candidate division KSB1 bacterium]